MGSPELVVIAETTAEEREFSELRRELPLVTNVGSATEALFRHLRRVVPAVNMTLFVAAAERDEIRVVACAGAKIGTCRPPDLNR